MSQPHLFESEFQTLRPANPLYCHQEFLEKIEELRNQPVGRKAGLLLQRLAVDARRIHYKATYGPNRGWRRSRLGGNQGSHFYAWWAPQGAPPLKSSSEFRDAQQGAIFVRDIRHHDDHSPLTPQSLVDHYLPLSVQDLRQEAYAPAPWTQGQSRFAKTRGIVKLLKGHPGSGKTTALLHAADQANAERVLYITFSNDLAALARDYFERYCAADRKFHVVTFPHFLRQLLGSDAPIGNDADARNQFRRDLGLHQRSLGPWAQEISALYDEFHAHLTGSALPEPAGRFPKAERLRLPEKAFREQRTRFLGPDGVAAALDAAQRLEKMDPAPLADRYFPELALAWRAAHALNHNTVPQNMLPFDCIAVDECQDLTPLECYVIIAMARRLNQKSTTPLLLAGDEAQTVRPTDFEWAWLNDMLHHLLSTPTEFKLSTNLRSPRRIAELVNRVWDLYGHVDKKDRPSGSGYAEIDDDSTDQVLYCAATAGEDLNSLLSDLAQREGMALISFNTETVPEHVRPYTLTPAEVKGLDFHSVCVLDAGQQFMRVVDRKDYWYAGLDSLRRRLWIDQLRVALSRPAERLFWIDVGPAPQMTSEVQRFLRPLSEMALPPVTAEALRKSLEEEELDLEERIQRCMQDARQLIDVKPDLAWSRAQQAVALLGDPMQPVSINDFTVRDTAYLALAEVCFKLGFRKARLSPELGRPDLFLEAARAARAGRKFGLANVIQSSGSVHDAVPPGRAPRAAELAQIAAENKDELESWLLAEILPRAEDWIREMEDTMSVEDNARVAMDILPPFYDALRLPDAAERKQNLSRRAIQILLKNKKYRSALSVLEKLPKRQPALEAQCLEETGEFAKAAQAYRELGDLEKALRCYRAIPDFANALELVRQLDTHSARESLEWLAELDKLVARRPEKFNRVMLASEKKLLEDMLERALGVQRRKPVPRKAASGKTQTRKPAVKKPPVKRSPVRRSPF